MDLALQAQIQVLNRSQLQRIESKLQASADTPFAVFYNPEKNYYACRFMLGSKLQDINITESMLGPAREVDFCNILYDAYPELFL